MFFFHIDFKYIVSDTLSVVGNQREKECKRIIFRYNRLVYEKYHMISMLSDEIKTCMWTKIMVLLIGLFYNRKKI